MNIALVRKDYKDTHGGAERYAVYLARGLADRGHRVHVFAGNYDPEPHPCITIHRVAFLAAPSSLKNLSFQRNVRRQLAGGRFDIINGLSQIFPQDVYRLGDGIHAHWLNIQAPRPGRRLLTLLSPRHQVILAIERRIFKPGNYRRIIANSRMCKKQLLDYYRVPEHRISLVYNGVDVTRFHSGNRDRVRAGIRTQLGIAPQDIVLLFVGHNLRRKGLPHALACLRALKTQMTSVKLVVAGRGDPAPFVQAAKQAGIQNDVRFVGHTSEVEDLYRASDLLVHPALYDPFSNVCLEAMASGLPVITTKHTGTSEIMENGISGIVLDSAQAVRDMVAAVLSLLKNKGAGLRFVGQKAEQTARRYTLERNVAATLKVYESVCHEKGLPV